MAKQLNVSLAFSADTSKAKAQLQDLQRQLTNLTNSTGNIANSQGMGITKQLHEASMAAAQLKVQLQDATNVNTGKLDLVKFNQSLKASGMDLQQYKNQLMALGPAGAQAFSGLAAAVTNAEAPIFRVSNRIRELGTVLKNTVRWQVSSSLLHGFMGTIQGAYGYAKDLNESLNNIRIVTGQSTDQMAKFAKEANKAAKALSSTTTEYTDAALIYYQQGLSGEQVKERAEVTLKMANVSRQSAETVSQQMTSVWNNFYDGGKSLEYYSDVMVALGAATASSSDEIATGLEKFSAVSNTVGLSYEYAAAALATVTAQTRQSADTVGTAFRTLFTRLEGLNLGETAEDGTTLNKYSEALYKVGVNIKDQQGQLKDMDQILDELGAKWQTIGKEQQVALAQTVGGARQYATLIALMDNWDFFQQNLGTAKGSEGALQEQADIYAESWEAARERVTASLQKIYGELLNDKFFIGLNNGFAGFLDIIGNVIDGLGGLKGVLLSIGTILITVYQDQLANSLRSISTTVFSWTKAGKQEFIDLKNSASSALKEIKLPNMANLYKNQATIQESYLKNIKSMNEEEQKRAKILMEQHGYLAQQVIDSANLLDKANQNSSSVTYAAKAKIRQFNANNTQNQVNTNLIDAYRKQMTQTTATESLLNTSFDFRGKNLTRGSDDYKQLISQLTSFYKSDSFKNLENKFSEQTMAGFKNLRQVLADSSKPVKDIDKALNELFTTNDRLQDEAAQTANTLRQADVNVDELTNSYIDNGNATAKNTIELINFDRATNEVKNSLTELSGAKIQDWASNAVSFARGLGTAAMAFSSLVSLAKTWNNEDISFGDKLLQTMQTLAFVLPAIIGLLEKESVATAVAATWNKFYGAAKEGNLLVTIKETVAQGANTAAKWVNTAATTALTIANNLLNLSLSGTLASILALLAPIALLIAAFAGIVWIFNKIKENSPEAKLEKAKEETERCAQAAQNANNAYSELLNTLNSFDSAYDKIANLTRETVEWRQAIAEVNQDINELIKKYPELEKYVDVDGNGAKHISEEGQEWLKEQEYQNTILAQNALAAAQGVERNAEVKLARDNISWVNRAQRDKVEILSGLGITDLSDTQGIKEKTNWSDAYIKALQSENAQAYLDALNADAIGDQLDAENLISQRSDIFDQLYGEDSNVSSQLASAVMSVLGENLNADIQQRLENGKYSELSTKDKQAYAKANNYEYDVKEDKFYSLDEEGKRDKDVTKDIQENLNWLAAQTEALKNLTLDSEVWKDAETRQAKLTEEEINKIANQSENERASNYSSSLDGDDKKIWDEYNEYLKENYKNLEDNEEMADRITSANMQMNDGLEDIIDNYEDYIAALDDSNKGSEDYSSALNAVKTNFSKILDLNIEDISDEFATSEDNLKLMKQAAEGSLEAITQLRENAALDIIADIDNTAFDTELNWIREQIANSEEFENLEIGATLDDSEFVNTLNELVKNSIITVDEAQKILNSLGFEPEITYKEVGLEEAGKYEGQVMVSDGNGGFVAATQDLSSYEEHKFYIPTINGSKTTYRGSPKATVSTANKIAAKKNSSSQKDVKKNKDEIERYHVIKEQIEDINNELDRMSKAKDRAFGGDKIALMDEEIAKTEELVEAQKAYLKEIEAYYDKDKAAIAAYGAQFDMNGVITNYDALIAAQVAKFNATRTDAAEEEFEKFKDVLEQYEETSDLVAEERQELIDKENELADLLLEQLQYKIELEVEIIDDDLKYLDFLLKQVDDSAYEAADAIALLGQKTSETMKKVDTYTKGINDLFKNHGFIGDVTELLTDGKTDLLELADAYSFTEEEVETLREYRDGLMESTEQLMDLRQEIQDKVIPAFEDLTAEMDNEIDKLDHLSTMLGYYKDIIDIIGKDTLGISDELMASLSVAQVDNAINKVTSSFAKLEGMRESRNELQKSLEDAQAVGNEDLVEFYKDALAEIDKQIAESAENVQDTLIEALQSVTDAYDAAVQRSIERFEKAVSGAYGNLAALQDAYDKQKTVDERYIEDYEKIYELNKLNRDISNSIDNTDNIKGKQMLIDLQKEINALEESGVKLSEYDVNFLRQKYELRLAEIALEEAQNAKSQVRMTRDSEGNWSYTYTADQNNIASAQQNYEDVLYETQQLSTEYINNLQGQIIDAQVAMTTELAQLRADDEEGRQRVIEHYQGQIDYLTSQLQGALDNNKLIYNEDWTAYNQATGYKISAQEDYLINFDQTNLAIMSGYETLQEFQDGFAKATQQLYEDITLAAEDWQLKTDEAMKAAGTSVDTFANDMGNAVNGAGGIVDQSNTAKDSVVEMGQTMATTFGNVLTAVDNFETNYGKLIDGVIADNNVLIDSCNDIIRAWALVDAAEKRQSFNTYDHKTGGTTDVSIDDPTGDGPGGSGKKYVVSVTNRYGYTDTFPTDDKKEAQAKFDEWVSYYKQYPAYNGYPTKNFDTGGYTGAWGLSGKLAFLHEKELVLNKEDTSNILSAVKLIREISGLIDYRTALMGVSSLQNARLDYLQEGFEQNVHIEANFPNATNREEIRSAFSDLINRASQFANRKG